jgi:prolyl-tRNA synthetase
VPIYKSDEEKTRVLEAVQRVQNGLSGFRIKIDNRDEVTPGYKFNDWEMRGIPLRIEIGPKDVEKGSVTIARRDIPGKKGKSQLSQENLALSINEMLDIIHTSLHDRALAFRQAHTYDPREFNELIEAVQNGWAYSWWCESQACEAKVKEETKATTRCMPLDQEEGEGRCIVCGEPAYRKVIFARAY